MSHGKEWASGVSFSFHSSQSFLLPRTFSLELSSKETIKIKTLFIWELEAAKKVSGILNLWHFNTFIHYYTLDVLTLTSITSPLDLQDVHLRYKIIPTSETHMTEELMLFEPSHTSSSALSKQGVFFRTLQQEVLRKSWVLFQWLWFGGSVMSLAHSGHWVVVVEWVRVIAALPLLTHLHQCPLNPKDPKFCGRPHPPSSAPQLPVACHTIHWMDWFCRLNPAHRSNIWYPYCKQSLQMGTSKNRAEQQ